MESNFNFRSSDESNYGRNYGGYSSESSYSSESRNNYMSSESRKQSISSESRKPIWGTPADYENGWGLSNNASKISSTYNGKERKYNNLDDVDKLIERLEASLSGNQVTSERANQILAQRKQKLDELKKLVAAARNAEEKMIRQLEQDNNELDEAIDSINKGLRK